MIALKIILSTIFAFIILAIPAALFWSIISWIFSWSEGQIKIKFKDFVELYNLDSSKCKLGDYNPKCRKESYHSSWDSYLTFKLNYIDFCRYKVWKYNVEKRNKQQRAQAEFQEILSQFKGTNWEYKNPAVICECEPEERKKMHDVVMAAIRKLGYDVEENKEE